MLSVRDLKKLSRARLADAEILLGAGRYDGGAYLCGYAIEIALKARICQTLKWSGFPSTSAEFQYYASFKTHNLDVLLRLSAKENVVKTKLLADWSIVAGWNPEARYKLTGSTSKGDLTTMITSAQKIIKVL